MSSSLFIANPVSRGGKNRRFQETVQCWVEQNLAGAEWRVTEQKGDAIRFAAQAAKGGFGRIFVLGGDGTLHEVLQGIAAYPEAQRPALGVLGGGTGGDYGRRLRELYGDFKPLDRMLETREISVDFGRAIFLDPSGAPKTRFFINVADLGLSGLVVQRTEEGGKRWGRFHYLLAALRSVREYRPPLVRLLSPEQIRNKFKDPFPLFMAVVAKGRYFGGGMAIAPQARLDDGHFLILLAPPIPYRKLCRLIPALYRKAPLHHPLIHYERAKEFHLKALEGLLPLDLDGEPFQAREVEFAICPGGLKIVVPVVSGRLG